MKRGTKRCIDCRIRVRARGDRCGACRAEERRRWLAANPLPRCHCGKQLADHKFTHCRTHAKRGVPPNTPSSDQWIAAVKSETDRLHIPLGKTLAGNRPRKFTLARVRAWKRLLDTGFPYAGIARVSGYHHTTIISGVRGLKKLEGIVKRKTASTLPWNAPIRERLEMSDNLRAA